MAAWIAGIVALLADLLKALPILNKWFTKTPVEKQDDAKEEIREESKNFEETGRPDWD